MEGAGGIAIRAEAVAEAIAYAVDQPVDVGVDVGVGVNELVVRPTAWC
ncbi:hypothetical protein ABZ612_13595 [Streptomyces avermitilis]